MVSRLEIALIIGILIFASKDSIMEISKSKPNSTNGQKQIELSSVLLREVNKTALQSQITASNVSRYKTYTTFGEIKLQTDMFVMTAKKARQEGGIITLEQNTTLTQLNGSRYNASKVIYDKNTRLLTVLDTFGYSDYRGTIVGKKLKFDLKNRSTSGGEVEAVYELD
ncbi:MAG: hypothetical protein HF962_08075 [Sulfurovum sp.]|nr:hypothetical protein [Sulfurovum sp.]